MSQDTHKHDASDSVIFICPMHSHVTSDKPGSCPECNMDLVRESELNGSHHHDHSEHQHGETDHIEEVDTTLPYYACPMHPEVVSQNPGMCPKCHMALEKVNSTKAGSKSSVHKGHKTNIFKEKFWVSLILTIPTVFLSPTIQYWLGFEISFTGSEYIPAVLGVVIFLYGGLVFLKSARGEVSAKRPGMMTLISMAISVALIYSLLVTFNIVEGMDFWWELATLVTIMLLGHWIEMASVENAQGALGELSKLLPDEAELVDGDRFEVIPVSSLKVGDKVRIRPGLSVSIDGEVVSGESKVNESMLTGESRLVVKGSGDKVIGGTINGDGSLIVKVTETGSDTTLAGIMKMVEEAQASKSRAQVLADKAAFYLFYISVVVAALTAVGWFIAGASAGFILERVVTVLIIACPHALGLAIPLVTAISTTHAAKNGLLVRQRIALESARNVDVVLFDKTGTLTEGKQGVVQVESDDAFRMLSVASAVERESEHSIAKAVVAYAEEKSIQQLPADDFVNLPGRGVKATVEGRIVHVGGPSLIKELKCEIEDSIKSVVKAASSQGKTVIYVIEDSQVLGVLMLADVIREESRAAVKGLRSEGKRVAILTGDSEGVAKWVANELGIKEYFAGVLPEDKASIVEKLHNDGSTVAMVGDGVNDAPALTKADIGIAIGAGTDVAIESADIVLASNDPRGVSKIVTLSKATYSKMVQNLIWATGYNALALPLAAGVTASAGFILSPAIGAVMMSLSTVIVAVNAQLLRRLKLD